MNIHCQLNCCSFLLLFCTACICTAHAVFLCRTVPTQTTYRFCAWRLPVVNHFLIESTIDRLKSLQLARFRHFPCFEAEIAGKFGNKNLQLLFKGNVTIIRKAKILEFFVNKFERARTQSCLNGFWRAWCLAEISWQRLYLFQMIQGDAIKMRLYKDKTRAGCFLQ